MDFTITARSVWQAFMSRSEASIHEVLTEDVEWIAPKANATAVALGVTEHMVGRSAIAGFILNDFPRLFSNGMDIETVSVTAQDNRVVFEQRQTAILANGRTYDNVYVFIFEMEGVRVRRIREYMDTHGGYQMVFGENAPSKIV